MKEAEVSVSVIIPTYNRAKMVQEAIDSIWTQTYHGFEIIVVDDGSTDGTGDILKTRYGEKIVYLWQENKGGPTARNLGLSVAQGKYIGFLDSDDLWLPQKLARQVPILENNPEIAVVTCQAWHIDEQDRKLSTVPLGVHTKSSDFTVENLLMYNKIPAGPTTCLVRRSVLDRVGGFSEDIRWGAEWDVWLRIAAYSELFMLPEPLACYRRLKKSLSFFSNIQHVERALADRLTIIHRCMEQYPREIPQQKINRALAYQYAKAGLDSFLLNEKDKGKEWVSKTVELCPGFWKSESDFSNDVTVFALSYSIDQVSDFAPKLALSFVDLLCANLPETLNKKSWIRLTQANVRREVGFYQYKNGERPAGLHQILNAILWSPRLLDLSVLAICAELVVGRGLVNRLRELRHQKR